jgi:phosphonate transport system ATP-binding protein
LDSSVLGDEATSQEPPLFRLDRVHRTWGNNVALDDLSMTIRSGEMVLLAGPSGSGKTSLLRMLAGVLRPSRGTIEVEGSNLMSMVTRDLRRHQSRCGIVEQGALLIPQLSVHRNVLAGQLAHMPWHKILLSALWRIERDAVRKLLDLVGLSDRQWDPAANLSGGEQQRVSICRALISSPMIILADEPTASLDPKTASDVTRLLIEQARARSATLVFSSHWLSVVLNEVDRVIGLRKGRLVIDASPADVNDDTLEFLYRGSYERA